jgi:hypothetical protein
MRKQQWVIFFVAFALMAGTAASLSWLKNRQKLGQPGLKATPISGSVAMNIDLPEHVLDFTSTNVPESEVELNYFPRDTSYARRFYHAPDGFGISSVVILMGTDRTSIHRPEYCLVGQGWRIDEKKEVKIPIAGAPAYELPVMKWTLSSIYQAPDGQKIQVRGLFVFWFVADNEQTTSSIWLQGRIVRDLLLSGVLQRWAYVSYFAVCAPGEEDATFERLKKLIGAAVPEFQVAPKSQTAPGPG